MQTTSWDKRVTTFIFGMCYVDAWLIHRGYIINTLYEDPDLALQEFYCVLVEKLIDNIIWKRRRTRS